HARRILGAGRILGGDRDELAREVGHLAAKPAHARVDLLMQIAVGTSGSSPHRADHRLIRPSASPPTRSTRSETPIPRNRAVTPLACARQSSAAAPATPPRPASAAAPTRRPAARRIVGL